MKAAVSLALTLAGLVVGGVIADVLLRRRLRATSLELFWTNRRELRNGGQRV